jgi:hypothetical protein
MKLYIGIEKFKQKHARKGLIYEAHGTTMAYVDREILEKVIAVDPDGFDVLEIEANV